VIANRKDMVEWFLDKGAKPNLPDDEPWATPLFWAEYRGHSDIIDLLKYHGATA
jgi:ankyrin repeat protein